MIATILTVVIDAIYNSGYYYNSPSVAGLITGINYINAVAVMIDVVGGYPLLGASNIVAITVVIASLLQRLLLLLLQLLLHKSFSLLALLISS